MKKKKRVVHKIKDFLKEHFLKILFLIGLLLLIPLYKNTFLILLFIILDYINSFSKRTYKIYLPIDFMLIAILFFSYFHSAKIGVLLSFIAMLNRIVLGKFAMRHVVKLPILLVISYLCDVLSFVDYIYLFVALILFRYIVEIFVNHFILGSDVKRITQIIYHLTFYIAFILVFGQLLRTLII